MSHAVRKLFHRIVLSIAAFAGIVLLAASCGYADQIPDGWTASNMKPIGYTGLDGRGGTFKMAIKQVGGRWYLYVGHLWNFGWDIVDVTDPANPKVAKFLEWPHNSHTDQVELDGNIMLTAQQKIQPGWGGDPNMPFDEGVLIWDISDPINPKLLSHWKTGSTGVHRIGYPGGKYANLAANMPGYKGQILVFLDISDPKNPKEAGRWWEPGQKEGEPAPPDGPVSFHGPAIIDGNKAYVGYYNEIVILDISDIASPKVIGQLKMWPPFHGGIPVHDVLPIPGKNLLFAHSEETGGDNANSAPCSQALSLVGMVDIKDEAKPRLMSIFPTPVPPGTAYTDFCDKGGRFGPHNTNLEYHLPDVEKQADLIYLAYFNAGLRVFNIADPRMPKEVGWFIPPSPTKRFGPVPEGKLVSQTEDVLVDTRGNVYITDKQWGLFVLRYLGSDEPAPTAH